MAVPDLQLRDAAKGDVPALIDLSQRTIRACYSPFLGAEAVEGWIESGEAANYVRLNAGRARVVTVADAVQGFCVCREDLLDLMMVDVRSHRCGFGSLLLADAEARLLSFYTSIRLECFADNAVATAFYCARGWGEGHRFPVPDLGVEKLEFRKARDESQSASRL